MKLERISDTEINKAFDGAFDKEVSFDHPPTPEDIILARLKAVAQAQLEADQKKIDIPKNILGRY